MMITANPGRLGPPLRFLFFPLYEELSDTSGNFGQVKSVAEIDGNTHSTVVPIDDRC
jgi:hypothetical protein